MGCGTGDPACSLVSSVLDNGFSRTINVVFQDYSQETIDSVTRPNVESKLGKLPDELKSLIKLHYVSSPWDSFSLEPLELANVQVILSSECVYREDLFDSFSAVLDKALAPSNSVCYIAAKRYYFGCGGGTIAFSEYLSSHPVYCHWRVNVVHVEENGFSNTREILEIHK